MLNVCDKWNLPISLTKRFWGRPKVDYLGHRVSRAGLEAFKIVSERSISSDVAIDAVFLGKSKLL